jgi:hypothetical protein
MADNKKHIINLEILDHYLGATGFIYPMNEKQLDLFEKLYEDFDFKLKNISIDVASIINNQLKKQPVIKLFANEDVKEIEGLKMVARKGSQLPQDIIDKMYGKHRKKSDDKE